MKRRNCPEDVTIRRTHDLEGALRLARQAGLEVSSDAGEPTALWGAYHDERIAGIVSLDEEAGLPVIGWIAVAEADRGRDIGRRLLAAVEAEARRHGVVTLWATARAPDFFLAVGYEVATAGEERELLLAGCRDCPQLGTTCRPQAVRRRLDGPDGGSSQR